MAPIQMTGQFAKRPHMITELDNNLCHLSVNTYVPIEKPGNHQYHLYKLTGVAVVSKSRFHKPIKIITDVTDGGNK